jgi:hypothetical protein
MTDPKVVLQAHALRAEATRAALLRGAQPARTSRTRLAPLWASAVLAIVLVGGVLLTVRIIGLLHGAHR